MLYAILIHQPLGATDHLTPQEQESMNAQHRALQKETQAQGTFVAATQLMEAYAATSVRRRGDRISIEEGPFAETKEMFIGLYLLDCETLEEALEFSKKIPHADFGTVEVRPVAYHEDTAGPFAQ